MSRWLLTIALATTTALSITEAAGPRARLIEARDLAYDANYRNDQAGLRAAIAALESLAKHGDEGAYAHYYLWWTYWALTASQAQDKDMAGGLASARLALQHARSAVASRDRDPEFQAALANALIGVGVMDRSGFEPVLKELTTVRAKAVELGPTNPRAVLMDAGVIFNTPPEAGGSQERGIARWQEALKLFEAEANEKTVDPIAPRWGHALAYGWMAGLYLRTSPPQKELARKAAETALEMRPDFWWVRDQILPQLRE
jgi:hypothetical protein